MTPKACCIASQRPTFPQTARRAGASWELSPRSRARRGPAVLERRMLAQRVAPLLLLLACACGRPATQQECDEIVVRVAELELKARGIAGRDSQEVRDTKEALRKTTLRDCVGRRISDKAMACVRAADTAQKLVNECF